MEQQDIISEEVFSRVTPKAESFSIRCYKGELVEISIDGKVVKNLVIPVNGTLSCYFNKIKL